MDKKDRKALGKIIFHGFKYTWYIITFDTLVLLFVIIMVSK